MPCTVPEFRRRKAKINVAVKAELWTLIANLELVVRFQVSFSDLTSKLFSMENLLDSCEKSPDLPSILAEFRPVLIESNQEKDSAVIVAEEQNISTIAKYTPKFKCNFCFPIFGAIHRAASSSPEYLKNTVQKSNESSYRKRAGRLRID
jgi:hypothetical protein